MIHVRLSPFSLSFTLLLVLVASLIRIIYSDNPKDICMGTICLWESTDKCTWTYLRDRGAFNIQGWVFLLCLHWVKCEIRGILGWYLEAGEISKTYQILNPSIFPQKLWWATDGYLFISFEFECHGREAQVKGGVREEDNYFMFFSVVSLSRCWKWFNSWMAAKSF